MSRRVVVTGMGAITPIGLNIEEFWAGVKEGKIGFDEITHFDTTDYKCKLAAEVKGFDPKEFMDFRSAKRMEPFSQYAVAATKEAIEDAGLIWKRKIRTAWAARSAPVSEVCRQSSGNIKNCLKKDHPEIIRF